MSNVPAFEQIRDILQRRHRHTLDDKPFARAAVLLGLCPIADDYLLLFTKRTSLVAHHKGEICFPGGVKHAIDVSLEETALRETFEEIGIRPEQVSLLGELDDVATISGFIVTPFVGQISPPCEFKASHEEVEELLQVPLSHLHNPQNQIDEIMIVEGTQIKAPSYRYGQHLIWGATARILHQFLGLISEIGSRAA